MSDEIVMTLILALCFGSGFGCLCLWLFQRMKYGTYQKIAQEIIQKAEQESANLKKASELLTKQHQVEQQRELEHVWHSERKKIQREEERLKQREDKLESRMNLVEKKLSNIEKREAIILARKAQIDEEKKHFNESKQKLIEELERTSGLSANEAKELLINKINHDVKTDAANLIRRCLKEAEEEAERKANTIIATAINRLASSCVSETTINTVTIPNEDMKGRIIGEKGEILEPWNGQQGLISLLMTLPVLSFYQALTQFAFK